MRHADFPVPPVDLAAPGPTFTLADEKFRCLPEMPAGPFLFVPDGQLTYSASWRFIHGCLVPEDEERFDQILAGKERIVGLELLHQITAWLVADAWAPEEAPTPEVVEG